MTARDAFSLPPRDWEDVERHYEKVAGMTAEEMLLILLEGSTNDQQKWLALGIMVGRASR
ncbi:hypothetical protein M0R72_11150 [Candidatus Pacearchaeota archaeon]|jgi:hypothetical protein|nr:hypothetical protein [Candidatus Pacearchaeota archaeon]